MLICDLVGRWISRFGNLDLKIDEMDKSSLYTLQVWQESRAFRNDISSLVKTFPTEEKYRLVDQMIRASRSITANIAERYGRFHYQENIQFCRQARGSLVELCDHLTVALDEGFIDPNTFQTYSSKYEAIHKLLNRIYSLLKQAEGGVIES